jgi:hypothetical protein
MRKSETTYILIYYLGLLVLVSQGVISRNYDDSQYNGLILIDWEEELRVAHLTTYTRLALSRSLCDS